MARGGDWRLVSLPVCAAVFESVWEQTLPIQRYLSLFHLPALFLPFLTLLTVTLHLSCCLSLYLCLSGNTFHLFLFYTTCCHHLSSSVSNIIQSIQSVPKLCQKILPILPHCCVFPSGSALPLSLRMGETPSLPHRLILPVLPATVLRGRLQHTTKEETCKERILFVLFTDTFSVEWG